MIKVENEMLVLDSTFSKEDVEAIDEFVKINVDRELRRIVDLLEEVERDYPPIIDYITLIKILGE